MALVLCCAAGLCQGRGLWREADPNTPTPGVVVWVVSRKDPKTGKNPHPRVAGRITNAREVLTVL